MGKWPDHYILVGRIPIAVDLLTFARWFETSFKQRRIARDEFDDVAVSTVFLGLDHSWIDDKDPVLFETLIFGGPLDGEMWRYCTYAEAERGHAEAVAQARKASDQIKAIAKQAGAEIKS
jgi:hypothetical protein